MRACVGVCEWWCKQNGWCRKNQSFCNPTLSLFLPLFHGSYTSFSFPIADRIHINSRVHSLTTRITPTRVLLLSVELTLCRTQPSLTILQGKSVLRCTTCVIFDTFVSFTMSSQPTTPRPSSSHSSPGDNHNSDETHPQTTSAQPQHQQQQEQQEEVKHTNAVERPPVLPSLISPIHDQPTSPRGGGGKMRSSRSSDNSIPRHPRQSSASYGVEESGPKFGATKYAGNIYAVDRTTVYVFCHVLRLLCVSWIV